MRHMTNTAHTEADGVEYVNIDVEVGILVQSLMFRARHRQEDLGSIIGNTKGTVSRKLRGQVTFSVTDLMRIARAYEVDPGDLLPRLDSNQQPCGYPFSLVGGGDDDGGEGSPTDEQLEAWGSAFDFYAAGLRALTPGERWRDWTLEQGSHAYSRVLGFAELRRLTDRWV